MRLARIRLAGGTSLARVDGELVTPVAHRGGDLLRALADPAGVTTTDDARPLSDCELIAPLPAPGTILAVGLNYADHAAEAGLQLPAAPLLFTKTANCVVGPADPVCFPAEETTAVDYEVELAVVIGRRATRVSEVDALDHVAGYLVANDVSARDLQFADGQWTRGKCLDTFCPTGPWVTSADEVPDPQDLRLSCRVNGVTLQDGSTADMVFGVAEVIAYVSRYITLAPGDLLLTGTPAGVGMARDPQIWLRDGDLVETEVQNLGTLTNPVVARRTVPLVV